MAVFVPFEDDLLRYNLSLVEKQNDLIEVLEEVLVVITILLNLVEKHHLWLGAARE